MRTPTRLRGLALVAGLVLLTGCNLISVEPAATPTPVTPPTTTPVPVSDPTAPFVTFQVSGGIAGLQRAVSVQAGGAATLTERAQVIGTAQVPPARLAEIRAKLDAAQFFTLQDRYDNGRVADDIYYTITATEDGQTKKVTVAEVGGKESTPQAVIDLITNLRDLEGTVRASLTPAPAAAPATPLPPGSEVTVTPGGPVLPTYTPEATQPPTAPETPTPLTPFPLNATPAPPAATRTPVAGTPEPAAATATTEAGTVNEGADLIIYRVRGGIAGLDTAMFIGRRGTVTFQSRGQETGRAQLTAAQVGELIDLFDSSGFFTFQDRYAPAAAPADSQELSVTYNHGGQVKTVTVATEGQPPAALQTILDRLAALQADLQKK
jgi:hypothetical protein